MIIYVLPLTECSGPEIGYAKGMGTMYQ